jgi:hypothetical protein
MPERLPVMNKNGTLGGFLDQQYLLLTNFSPIIESYMPSEVVALEFLEKLPLSKHLNHHIFDKS